jgi:hypothetical protein
MHQDVASFSEKRSHAVADVQPPGFERGIRYSTVPDRRMVPLQASPFGLVSESIERRNSGFAGLDQ